MATQEVNNSWANILKSTACEGIKLFLNCEYIIIKICFLNFKLKHLGPMLQ